MNLLRIDSDLLVLDLIGDDERGYDFITDEQILELKRLSPQWGVVSLYLDVTPEAIQREAPLVQLRNGFKRLAERYETEWSHEARQTFQAVAADLESRVERWLDRPRGRGLALFAEPERVQPKKGAVSYRLIRHYHLPEAPRNRVEWGQAPVLVPLLVQRARHPDTGVVLFDRRRVRFFLQHMGEVAEYDFNLLNPDATPMTRAHTWHGYGEHNHHQWQQEHYRRYLRQAALAVAKVADKAGWTQLVLAAADGQEAHHLETHLPENWRRRVVGRVELPLDADLNRVREAVLPVVEQAAEAREKEALARLDEALERGDGSAVVGVDSVLLAAQEYRVETLFILPDLALEGWRCGRCGGLAEADAVQCPYCGADRMDRLPDLAGELAMDTFRAGGDVLAVQTQEGRATLERHGGVGALLRY